MSLAVEVPLLGSIRMPSIRQQEILLRSLILALVCLMGFSIRLFSVLRYESIIHEFDPWFNFRSTKVLIEQGTYKFWNWFDEISWYPIGRIVGGTVYPGIMYTAMVVYKLMHAFGFMVDIRDVCVCIGPIFSGLTGIAAYSLTTEVSDAPAGVLAAALMVIVPGYISRSVAGSYDNESVAITALVSVFFFFAKSVNTGSMFWAAATSISYLYMVSTWGGYIFIINLVPIYTLVLMISGRYSSRLYVAYNIFYITGTLLSMQIRFVGFNAVQSSEHLGAFGVFGIINLYAVIQWVQSFTSKKVFDNFVKFLLLLFSLAVVLALVAGYATGYIGPWTGRFYSLLDPTYAKKNIPIIASVSEHQPTAWGSYYFDLQMVMFFFPLGLYFCFKKLNDTNILLIVYGTFSIYFSGVMVRLMLVLAPVATMLGAIGVSNLIRPFIVDAKSVSRLPESRDLDSTAEISIKGKNKKSEKKKDQTLSEAPYKKEVGFFFLACIGAVLFSYVRHAVWVTSEAYSSPSVVLSTRDQLGHRIYYDDYREAYYWLRMNTKPDSKVLSWWDYGYQLAGFANRTTIVDNNTWNNSHIATVGRVMNSPEQKAHKIARKLDVDYVLVIFGGYLGYSSDDINKFLWMVRIPGSVDPSVNEADYLAKDGNYIIQEGAGEGLRNSLMYKLCYYRFGEFSRYPGAPKGYDLVRREVPADTDIELKYFEEAFTSQNWIVRIYKVKDADNRGWL